MGTTLLNISNNYNLLKDDANEETVKIMVIIDLLEHLGYKRNSLSFEDINISGRCDILIKINNNDKLIVETKRKNHIINTKDCGQLCNYMTSKNIDWGILTNGNDIYLLNKNIYGEAHEKICLGLQLIHKKRLPLFPTSKTSNNELLQYLTLNNIFKRKSTTFFYYFTDFINFSNNLSQNSIIQYRSSIFRFFKYLNQTTATACGDHLLCVESLEAYFINYSKNQTYKKDTITNSVRYISIFIKNLEDRNIIHSKNFSNFDVTNFVDNLEIIDNYKCYEDITLFEATTLIEYFETQTKFIRNKLIFKLFMYVSPSIDTIINLNINDVDTKNFKFIKINNYTLPLPPSLSNDLKEYFNYRKLLNVKIQYLFFTNYSKKIKQMNVNTITGFISKSFNALPEISDSRQKELNIQNIQKSVIKQMFKKGFSLEEVTTITNISVGRLYKYMDDETINKRLKNLNKSLTSKLHPYYGLFK